MDTSGTQQGANMVMDNTLMHVLHGCKLADELRLCLPNMAREPHLLLQACKEIVNTFNKAIHGVISQPVFNVTVTGNMDKLHQDHQDPYTSLGISWPSSGHPSTQLLEADTMIGSSSGVDQRLGEKSSKRPKNKRKDGEGMHTVRVPAPLSGNTEIPPDDGFTWRKYGQKDILGSRFPRSYYRCTHKIFYGCNAKKKVQRLNEDPLTYEVSYSGNHSCMTTITPVTIPGVPGELDTGVSSSISTPTPLRRWFMGNIEGTQRGNTEEHARGDADYQPSDLADELFNSLGSRSTMEGIFPTKQDK
ncbi:WRKY domain-containing protein [Dioscorea alata]|uniref:WRKY domain-containing protein n=1 Tax=Dioscorea alata TaxID=55571 RepID=A0ACB7V2V9_DIOAL|nr:WRKY domain-containing protein [Dioscorea alata]